MWAFLSMFLAACSLCLLAWWAVRPLSATPLSATQHKPVFVRLLWPWVEALAVVCHSFLSWRLRRRIERLLSQGAAAPYWSPQHFCAMQCVIAILLCAAMAVVLVGRVSAAVTLASIFLAATGAAAWPVQRLRERAQRRKRAMLRELPFILDMVTLCVEAGLNLHGALKQAAENGPEGPLRDELRHLLSDIRAGMPRQEALLGWAQRCDLAPVHQFVAAIGQAEHSGMNLGPVLRAQAEQWRTERFLLAEKLALQAPVKLMFPLVFCIFPCSFLIIGFPIAMQFMEMIG